MHCPVPVAELLFGEVIILDPIDHPSVRQPFFHQVLAYLSGVQPFLEERPELIPEHISVSFFTSKLRARAPRLIASARLFVPSPYQSIIVPGFAFPALPDGFRIFLWLGFPARCRPCLGAGTVGRSTVAFLLSGGAVRICAPRPVGVPALVYARGHPSKRRVRPRHVDGPTLVAFFSDPAAVLDVLPTVICA